MLIYMKIIKVDSPSQVDTLNKEMKNPNIIAFVKIYRDGCHFCDDLKPKWSKLEEELKNESLEGILASLPQKYVDDTDCDTDIKGVPTLRVFQGGVRKMDYEGKRETSDMKSFFKNLLKKGGRRKSRRRKSPRRKSPRRKSRRRKSCRKKSCRRKSRRRKSRRRKSHRRKSQRRR